MISIVLNAFKKQDFVTWIKTKDSKHAKTRISIIEQKNLPTNFVPNC
jgi:hypothetical protein